MPEPCTCPLTILIDGREQARWRFEGFRVDDGTPVVDRDTGLPRNPRAKEIGAELYVPWEWASLPTGDYSVKGLERLVTVERKSVADLYSTLGQGRERFEREHERMASFAYAAVVIEGAWNDILHFKPPQSELLPKVVFRTALSWSQRFGVHYFTCDDRALAEICAFHILLRFWKEHHGHRTRRHAG